MAITFVHKRVRREMVALTRNPPPFISLYDELTETYDHSLKQFTVLIKGTDDSLYKGEEFKLYFTFPDRYPFDPPKVRFVGEHIPVNPHVYSNGHICLNILTEDWSTSLSAEAICLSIVSLLSGCKEKKPPHDNDYYVKRHTPESEPGKFDYSGEE